jgi:hypothetical protein
MQSTETTGRGTSAELVTRQVSLLKDFAKFQRVLDGVVAFLWLPGMHKKFDRPRQVVGVRPLAVSLEVGAQGSLTLAVSKSRPVRNRMRYEVILRKDFTQPMTREGRGVVLAAGNEVMARRAINLLAALVRFGERRSYQPHAAKLNQPSHPVFLVPFDVGQEQIDQGKLARLALQSRGGLTSVEVEQQRLQSALTMQLRELPGVSLVDARIVPDEAVACAVAQGTGYEDFFPVLGAAHLNPVRRLHEMPNPAARLLERHGISDVGALDQATTDRLIAEMRNSALLGERLVEDEIFDALCNPDAPLYCRKSVNDVDGISNARVVEAMRLATGSNRAAMAATDEDLLEAAYSPRSPLVLSRLSRTQIVSASDLAELPAPYVGNFLPAPDWTPPRADRFTAAA